MGPEELQVETLSKLNSINHQRNQIFSYNNLQYAFWNGLAPHPVPELKSDADVSCQHEGHPMAVEIILIAVRHPQNHRRLSIPTGRTWDRKVLQEQKSWSWSRSR